MSKQHIYEGSIRNAIAQQSGDSKTLLRQFSAELFQTIEQALLTEGHIRLNKFGSFSLKWSKQRRGRNPQTGETIIIAAHPRVIFTPAKALKDKLNPQDIAQTDILQQEQAPNAKDQPKQLQLSREPYLIKNNHSQQKPDEKKSIRLIKPIAACLLIALFVIYFYPQQAQLPETNISAEIYSAPSPEKTREALPSNNEISFTKTSTLEPSIEEQQEAIPVATEIKQSPDKPTSAFFTERPHQLTDGDSLWRLSNKNYTNPFYWPHIYQANRLNIRNPNRLFTGRTITLPTLHGSPDSLTQKDKRHIAEGYFLIYLYQKKHNKPFPYYALLGASKYDPSIIEDRIYEIDEKDWQNLQLASN